MRWARLVVLFSVIGTASLGANQNLTLGICQPYGPQAAAKVAPLVEPYLSKALGVAVKVEQFPSPEDLVTALAAGKVDLAWITPLAFVEARKKNREVTALVKAFRNGGSFYRSVFFVKKASPLTSLDQLRGKSMAWVTPNSTSGYLFPRELLRAKGLGPEGFLKRELFLGNHPAVCQAVRRGEADVGATFAPERHEDRQEDSDAPTPQGCDDAPPVSDFRVLAATGNIPNEVIAIRSDFPETKVNPIISTFGRMGDSPEGKALLAEAFRVEGWGEAVEGDFAPVTELLDAKAKATPPAPAASTPEPVRKNQGKTK